MAINRLDISLLATNKKGKLMQHLPEHTKHLVDGVSVFTVVGALTTWLPPIAALFTIVWTAIRIWETKTVQRILGREGKVNE
jgi:hypothetical protein